MAWKMTQKRSLNVTSADGGNRNLDLSIENDKVIISLYLQSGEFYIQSKENGLPALYGVIDKEKGFFETIKFLESLINRHLQA